jgi:SnoaL-like domain
VTVEAKTRETIARYVRAVHDQELDTITSLQHPDFVEDWPQSRERIRGRTNFRKILENYPGGLTGVDADVSMDRVVGGEDRWMVAPTFAMVRVSAADDVHTAIVKLRYPDGGEWFMVALIELKDGLIHRCTSFFAPTYESPVWRREWVEQTTDA